ncbi:MAG: serine/threonine-protein kinase [Bacteroidota bacterium]
MSVNQWQRRDIGAAATLEKPAGVRGVRARGFVAGGSEGMVAFNPGEYLGPYRITEQLGKGGMATIYKAHHAALDRYVALKVLHPAFQDDRAFEMHFQREARLVARLEHPKIVPVYDYAEYGGCPCLVMKFIEGETLKSRLEKQPLSGEEILAIVESVGSALAYAHAQGVIHRDIKPSNVLMTADGAVYLTDFGIGGMLEASDPEATSDMVIATPQYLSPEQAMGTRELDETTDIYSFGVMLYEMIVGRVPFNAESAYSIVHDHIYKPLPRPRLVNPDVTEAVERVLLKSLAKLRGDRYESILDMVQAFKAAWNGAAPDMEPSGIPSPEEEPLPAPAMGPGPAAARLFPISRPRLWLLLAAAMLLILLLVIIAAAAARM